LGWYGLTIVGHLGSEQYIAAIAVGSMIFNVIYWCLAFLRMGTSGMNSQALGRADYSSVKRCFDGRSIVALAIAACFLVGSWCHCDGSR
jgi:MATE family multidrug resistance protein